MGLSTQQVLHDRQDEDWDKTNFLQSGTAEPPKPPPIRQQQPRSEPLKCPRCSSTNTKFCYFNNYNKSQPRHFCKSCKRHWTKGGTLRNVPVGGGRKNKGPKISTTSTTITAASRMQACRKFPVVTNIIDQETTFNTLYHSLILPLPLSCSSTNGIITKLVMGRNGTDNTTDLNVSEPQNLNPEFTFSSLDTFEMNSSSIMTPSYESITEYGQYYLNCFESIEESTITTENIPSTSSIPWPSPDTRTTGIEDFPNYWNCVWKNEIDLSTSSDINKVLDHDKTETKP
ncbi:hypothetical protein F511_32446 [Dorcoceras hygrometricum]|uniref:Dof zinc finger protein n=1 Tax=Dorcoceras hygrometricum TaxID=472368 RepID=A0A2Z7CG54_9LAMI|nr:hypothetical protein F511_32446 [Dorcoceras hygrometricum]